MPQFYATPVIQYKLLQILFCYTHIHIYIYILIGASNTMNTFGTWISTFEKNKYAEHCTNFINQVKMIVIGISQWVPTEPNKCSELNSINIFLEDLNNIDKYMEAVNHIDDLFRFLSFNNDKYSFREPHGLSKKIQKEIIKLYTETKKVNSLYQDVREFYDCVEEIEKGILELYNIVENLWLFNSMARSKIAQEWFPYMNFDVNNVFDDVNVFEFHVQLFEKYKESNSNLNGDQNNDIKGILQSLESIGKNLSKDKQTISLMRKWLGEIHLDGKTEDEFLQELKKEYLIEIEKYKNSNCSEMFNDTMKNLLNRYLKCLHETIEFNKIKHLKNIDNYLQLGPAPENIQLFLSKFRIYLLQILHFEKVKYMYLLLLTKKIRDDSIRNNIKEKYEYDYGYVSNIIFTSVGENKDDWNQGMSGVKEYDFTENNAMDHQLRVLNSSLIETMQLDPQQTPQSDQKNKLYETLRTAVLSYPNSLRQSVPSFNEQRIRLIRQIRDIICVL